MQFKFDPDQEYQLSAISAVLDLFEGQPSNKGSLVTSDDTNTVIAVRNELFLDQVALLNNLQTVQERNNLDKSIELKGFSTTISTSKGEQSIFFPNYSIEMETGTGKTYVYLRTIFQLYQRYHYRKFIIVVPSVAVREGVIKAIQLTEKHLLDLYANPPYNFFAYDSTNIAQIGNFAMSNGIEVMIMTLDAFNKSSNIINQDRDGMERPLWSLQASSPILILDEPQNMESELSKKALASLNPLFALRYSATHREIYNMIYRLTPYQAYRENLVKKLFVASVYREDDPNRPYIRLCRIDSTSKTITARLAAYERLISGAIKEKEFTLKPEDNLAEKTKNPLYNGYVLQSIERGYGNEDSRVRFSNGVEVRSSQPLGADRDKILARQIKYTIEEHFRKQSEYRNKGIKILSLFFIDRVSSYIEESGSIRQIFIQAFNTLKVDYPDWRDIAVEKVHSGYFSKKRKGSSDEFVDSSGETKEDNETYNLIMRDKEKLLSFEEPTAFIFSHSALREGWDNPNVFQICTLNQTTSEIKKRQEIGRGMRLAVNKEGDRIFETAYNALTIIANESYEQYVRSYQTELEEIYGVAGTPPPPVNALTRSANVAKRRNELFESQEFMDLWKKISRKTKYAVKLDSTELINKVVSDLEDENFHSARFFIKKAEVQIGRADKFDTVLTGSQVDNNLTTNSSYALPDLLEIVSGLLEYTTPPTALSRQTILNIYNKLSDRLKKVALENIHEFSGAMVRYIKLRSTEQLVEGIQYTPINDWYKQELIESEMSVKDAHFSSPLANGLGHGRNLYDKTPYDSQVELRFGEKLEQDNRVQMYFKLPNWFKVATPLGNYNPDWAVLLEVFNGHGVSQKKKLYLVRETKDTTILTELKQDERWKVKCGVQHFRVALGIDYKVITDTSDLPGDGWDGGIELTAE